MSHTSHLKHKNKHLVKALKLKVLLIENPKEFDKNNNYDLKFLPLLPISDFEFIVNVLKFMSLKAPCVCHHFAIISLIKPP